MKIQIFLVILLMALSLNVSAYDPNAGKKNTGSGVEVFVLPFPYKEWTIPIDDQEHDFRARLGYLGIALMLTGEVSFKKSLFDKYNTFIGVTGMAIWSIGGVAVHAGIETPTEKGELFFRLGVAHGRYTSADSKGALSESGTIPVAGMGYRY